MGSPVESKDVEEPAKCGFFYGTLMAPEVFFTVCYDTKNVPEEVKKRHNFHEAILHGYCRRRVRNADYPGITEDKEHTVRGIYVTGLSAHNMARLDFFEGSEYERRTVTVRLLEKIDKGDGTFELVEGEERTAEVYVFLPTGGLEGDEWDYEQFRREKMAYWTRAGYGFD
ncbi:disease resistance protein aig2-like protein [Thermochaetoides thermophila DSM 1495]|uniref:Putative gamma-glutamylcyclotransferase n=1 Tax=Chaetomium thermophilum (strain DSM 1495 / CBS 144.50 / IMI 039719) TaxID=759272 RepID=G0S840_CHATD|nr:disease resistance protein aig2-like protein [Thermochaetoides thermophila DSM 1495]EGS21087.1 disease resistance protein aig2-like protein [Thermochaetoides thermophila DSM 1495]